MSDKESRTEAATPTRLTKAINENGVATSRELGTLAGLAAALLVTGTVLPSATQNFATVLAGLLAHAGTIDSLAGLKTEVWNIGAATAGIILPLAGAISLAAIAGTTMQTGLRPNRTALSLHFSRLNPLSGLSNLFGARHMTETGQTIVKLAGIGVALYVVLSARFGQVEKALVHPVRLLPAVIFEAVIAMIGAAVLIQIVIAAVDFAMVKTQFATQVRMSQQEVKDEQKEMEGDPAVRNRLKALRNLMAKRSLKAAMARAAVVITNPTHYAVALEYRAGQTDAPKVVAKGVDEQAARIRELAQEVRVPIVANPPLARSLFRQEVEAEIAPEHYKAVAEVIAYIWKLAERRSGT